MSEPKPITDAQLRRFKPLMKVFSRINAWVFKASSGRWMSSFSGRPICVVTMKGARSNRWMDIPLMYVPFEDGVILVASMGGAPRHPTWYYNLVANPDIEVRAAGKTMKLSARQVEADEKDRLWPVCCEHYPDFANYQKRTDREIPVFNCQPAR